MQKQGKEKKRRLLTDAILRAAFNNKYVAKSKCCSTVQGCDHVSLFRQGDEADRLISNLKL